MQHQSQATHDTIAAIATGAAWSHRAIVRLTGPATHQLLNTWFKPHNTEPSGNNKPRRCETGRLILHNTDKQPSAAQQPSPLQTPLLLPCIALRFAGPESFTGEDSAELLFVGSPPVARRVLDRVLSWPGIRQAEPGEFSARAFLNGKLTLSQAEGVAATIAAESAQQLSAAERVLSGRAGASYRTAADELASLLALVEAGIDFTDQDDVVPIDAPTLAGRLHAVRTTLVSEAGERSSTEAIWTEINVVLVGPPNAGKSTLFNALLGKRRSLVSEQPGTTRDVLREPLDLTDELRTSGVFNDNNKASQVILTDLAGLDTTLGASSSIDTQAQSLAHEAIKHADMIVWCDPTGRFDPTLFSNIQLTQTTRLIRARTKADLPTPQDTLTSNQTHQSQLNICAIDGRNLGPLRRAIADAAHTFTHPSTNTNTDSNADTNTNITASAIAAVLPRHHRTATQAIREIDAALQLLSETAGHALRESPELVASALRASLNNVGELVGQITPDDVIGRVFATFCVGK